MASRTEISIDLTSHKDEVIKATSEQILQGLEGIGIEAERYAINDCPVKTGNLKSSIAHKPVPSELELHVGTNVDYARYVEYDDTKSHKTGKAHFLRDSLADHLDRYKAILKAALSS